MKIDKEFELLIPPLTAEELAGLEASILKEGCRDKLVTWQGLLLDGHNRYEICNRLEISCDTIEIDLPDRDAAKVWIINNQMGRRNLTDFVKFELEDAKQTILKAQAQEHRKAGRVLSTIDKTLNVQNVIADNLGKSSGWVAQAQQVHKLANDDVKKELRAGKKTINEVYKDLKAKAFKENIAQQKEDIAAGKVQLPKGKYEVISIDPPWPYGTSYEAEGRRVANPYPEMSVFEICAIKLPAAQDCCLYLWTTHQFLWDAFDLLAMWSFQYKQTLVWDKEIMGMGAWHRCQVEFCLFAVRGKPIWADHSQRDLIREKRREHSRKPDAFYQMVDATCVGRKLDYFSRTERPGWDCMGNDLRWKEGK